MQKSLSTKAVPKLSSKAIMMECSGCHKEKDIVNKYFKLCLKCNNIRLYGNEYGKRYKDTKKDRKSLRSEINGLKSNLNRLVYPVDVSSKKKTMQEKDEEFYEECFNSSDHICEECGDNLPKKFRGEDGKILARYRFSHIVAKSIAPELRHKIKNINDLCLKCHTKWDFGDRKSMKIYDKNKEKFPQFLK